MESSTARAEAEKRPSCPKGHPVPCKNCKYCAILGDLAGETRDNLIILLFGWHDAFYREERRANKLSEEIARLRKDSQLARKEPTMTAAERLQEIDRKAQTGEYLAVDVICETLKVAAEIVHDEWPTVRNATELANAILAEVEALKK